MRFIKICFTIIFSLSAILADEIDFSHDGWDRECYLYKPSCIPDTVPSEFEPVPLVLMLHGLGGEGADYYDFSSLAEDSCFVVAFPSGLFNAWNVGPEAQFSHDVDDNSYLEALIDTIYNNYPIDTNRIYGTGHSMGGGMTNHLACTSTQYTALASSGGFLTPAYSVGSDYWYLCDFQTNVYTIPTMHTHAIPDETVPVQYRQLAAIAASTRNFCKGPLDAWLGFDFDAVDWTVETDPTDFDDFINGFWATADTLEYTGTIHRYQWSHGCHTEPNTEVILLPSVGHAWHQLWNSPISTPLEHWNFFRQFSKDEMGPVLDSLSLPASETLDNDYYVNGETTPIWILAIDNYSVASMTISFSGFINVEGFDLTLTFDTNERLLDMEVGAILDPNISTDSYETIQIVIADHHGNEKVYEFDELQQLGLYQQMAVVNNITTSTDDMLSPQTFALHQNYPNPFNPETSISYDLARDGLVSIRVHDLRGTSVKALVRDVQPSGQKTVKWDGTNDLGQKVSAGFYFYRIEAEGFSDTKKMVLLK